MNALLPNKEPIHAKATNLFQIGYKTSKVKFYNGEETRAHVKPLFLILKPEKPAVNHF